MLPFSFSDVTAPTSEWPPTSARSRGLQERSDRLVARSHTLRNEATDIRRVAKDVRCELRKHRLASTARAIIVAVEAEAAKHPDPISGLVDRLHAAIAGEADPYLLVGVLLEAASHAIVKNIPTERRRETAVAAVAMLTSRLSANQIF